jgi:two-component system, NarL family, response regulator LiaR
VLAVVTTVDDAVRVAAEVLPDCVLMDLRLPVTNGIEGIRRVREVSPSTTVVALTASDDQHDLYEALRSGASGYVVKDSDVREIAGAVLAACRGQLVIPAHLVGAFLFDLEHGPTDSLGDEEREILARIAMGETNRDIAARLHLSERTVRRRVENLYAKLHLADRIEAALYASKQGIAPLDGDG